MRQARNGFGGERGGQALASAPWRDQFNSLKALNDAQAAQIAVLQNQLAAQQARWDALDNQLSTMSPLNISDADPLTQAEVQSIGAQSDLFLQALKGT